MRPEAATDLQAFTSLRKIRGRGRQSREKQSTSGKTGRSRTEREKRNGEAREGRAREIRNEVKIDSAGETSGSVLC